MKAVRTSAGERHVRSLSVREYRVLQDLIRDIPDGPEKDLVAATAVAAAALCRPDGSPLYGAPDAVGRAYDRDAAKAALTAAVDAAADELTLDDVRVVYAQAAELNGMRVEAEPGKGPASPPTNVSNCDSPSHSE